MSFGDLNQQITEAVERVVDGKLRTIIREEIAEALKSYDHTCRMTISDQEAVAVARYVKNVTRLSPMGDAEDGFDVIRDNHKWLSELRQGGKKAATAFFALLMTGAAAAFMAMLWEGFRAKVIGK